MEVRTFSAGDPEPTDVVMLTDSTNATEYSCTAWSKTFTPGEWKGYKGGGKTYLQWEELTREFGPLTTEGLSWTKADGDE